MGTPLSDSNRQKAALAIRVIAEVLGTCEEKDVTGGPVDQLARARTGITRALELDSCELLEAALGETKAAIHAVLDLVEREHQARLKETLH